MISVSDVRSSDIRFHYDLTTAFYRLLWGQHIHHGLWDAEPGLVIGDSPHAAQIHLINTLATKASISMGQRVLDVGCGMGGSSIHLARERHCDVTGITLSPVQKAWAATSAAFSGVRRRTQFHRADAERIEFPAGQFDVVWSIECTEHLFDKPAFFRKAATWLKPDGRMAICAWLAGQKSDTPDGAEQVRQVCENFLCPSLGSKQDYVDWMTAGSLEIVDVTDWTDQVLATWEICERRVRCTGMRWLAKLLDRKTRNFLDHFETILNAYRSRAMGYGCFVARKI